MAQSRSIILATSRSMNSVSASSKHCVDKPSFLSFFTNQTVTFLSLTLPIESFDGSSDNYKRRCQLGVLSPGRDLAVSAGESVGLGLRRPWQFGHVFRDFTTGPTREDSDSDPVTSEHRACAAVNHGRKRRDSEEESVKGVSTSNGGGSGNGVNDGKRIKTSSGNNKNESTKGEGEQHSSGKLAEQTCQPPPKQDYIHVRATRGQATDSHNLAERARREKISERMKILQDLVPGCNKEWLT